MPTFTDGQAELDPMAGWRIAKALLRECGELSKPTVGLQILLSKFKYHHQTPFYQTIANLGEGGYGRVELVELEGQRRVALKRMSKREILRDWGDGSGCDHETELAILKLRLKRSVGLVQAWQEGEDDLCLAMEWMEGGSLADLLDEQPLTEEAGLPMEWVRVYLAETILAMEELHQAGFVHCDLKPGNLLLCREGHLKLADFGSAVKIGQPLTAMRGTPDYVAPEMLQLKKELQANPLLDCWSLGVLLFELMTGTPPFYHDQLAQTLARIEAIKLDWSLIKDDQMADLLRGLLCPADQRLSIAQIKTHPLLANIEWTQLSSPPLIPTPRPLNLSLQEGLSRKPAKVKLQHLDGHHLAFADWAMDDEHDANFVMLPMAELESLLEKTNSSERRTVVQAMRRSSSTSLHCTAEVSRIDLEAAHECLRTNHDFLLAHFDQVEAERVRLEGRVEQLVEAMEELAALKQDLERDLQRERAKVRDLVGKLEQVMMSNGVVGDTSSGKAEVRLMRREIQRLQQRLLHYESTRLSRVPSLSPSCSPLMEGELRWFDQRKWRRIHASLRAGGLWVGSEQCLVKLGEDVVCWVQGVSVREVPLLTPKQAPCALKIRSMAVTSRRQPSSLLNSPRKQSATTSPSSLEAELAREQRIREGALQLVKAAPAQSDQARLAEAHVEAASRRIEALRLQMSDEASSIDSSLTVAGEDEHQWESTFTIGECACCQLSTLPGATLICPSCGVLVHRECQPIVAMGCGDAQLLRSVAPVYLLADSREEGHRWRLALERRNL